MPFTHVALIGLMGSGKSSVGQVLGERLGLPLVDVDDEILARTGRSVRELWEDGGEAAYRPLERSIVVESLTVGSGCVLAAPGGIAVDPVAMEALAQPHVAVAYLRARPEVLAERVRLDDQPRPLLASAPLEQLRAMFAARDRVYEALADRVEAIDERSPEQIALSVHDALAEDMDPAGLHHRTDG